ncbi:MAG TPA: nickel ABC transporter permease [bacterium]|nr:nickel ABC transporter permease [bacterium]
MIVYVVRRLLATVPVVVLVTVMVFLLLHITPGDPVVIMLGEEASPDTVAALRHALGLDQPLPAQYGTWLWHAAHGDLGASLRTHDPVGALVLARYPTTLELSALAMILSLCIAIPAGVLSAVRRNSWLDVLVTPLAISGISMPSFWLGILLIWFFSVLLPWFPTVGFVPLGVSLAGNLHTMVLPVVTLGAALAAIVMRITRASLLHVLQLDYVRTARAKGVRERGVVLRHALRTALIPVVTVLGLQTGSLLGGAVIVETIFALPGVGRLIVDAIFARDFPVVQGAVLVLALSFILVNLGVDLVYARLDPRIRYQ